MSTGLKQTKPFENILGFANVVDEAGRPMHKSTGNSIEFNEAADKAGVDVTRWLYATANPEYDLRFGFKVIDEARRRFYLILWNCYKFFVDYATLVDWNCQKTPDDIKHHLTVLDKWILARLTELVLLVNEKLEKYEAMTASKAIEEFVVEDLSTWYIRRSRDRVGPGVDKVDEGIFLATIYGVFVVLSKLLAPFMPFISEEIYRNLTGESSIHLQDYPLGDKSLLNDKLVADMKWVRKISEAGHAKRKEAGIKLRQPLSKLVYYNYGSPSMGKLDDELEEIIASELNVKKVEYIKSPADTLRVELDTKITQELKGEGEVRELIRQIQNMRKERGLTLNDRINLTLLSIPKTENLKQLVLKQTNANEIKIGDKLDIEVI